jgi:multidrug efflux pump subunit AcrB
MAPELPDPAFAKIVVLTPDAAARETLKHRLREAISKGSRPRPMSASRSSSSGPTRRSRSSSASWGPIRRNCTRSPKSPRPHARGRRRPAGEPRLGQSHARAALTFPDQDRLNLIGLSPAEVGQQLQFLLTGIPVTQVRENIRNVPVVARSAGAERLDPARLADFSLMSRDGRQVPLDQIGRSEIRFEEPILKRRDRTPIITIRSDINEATQPPEVSKQVMKALQPLIARSRSAIASRWAGSIEEATKANDALAKIFPVMIAVMLIVIMLQVRILSTMTMVMLTAPLGRDRRGADALLAFNQPFGFNAILGLIGLAGILMRNTLILTEQIKENQAAGLDDYHAVIEATVQRTRPVILTALAAVLAFIPLTHSVFWGSMAYTLIGGTAVGTVLILLFLPALYAAWFRIKPTADESGRSPSEPARRGNARSKSRL